METYCETKKRVQQCAQRGIVINTPIILHGSLPQFFMLLAFNSAISDISFDNSLPIESKMFIFTLNLNVETLK